jgi:hypothetical protein
MVFCNLTTVPAKIQTNPEGIVAVLKFFHQANTYFWSVLIKSHRAIDIFFRSELRA